MRLALTAVAAALGLGCPAIALGDQAPPASSSPKAEDSPYPLAQYYPDRAQRLGKSGKVILNCEITDQGGARDCQVVSEDPPDFGFGDKALEMVPLLKSKPGTYAPGERQSFPVDFTLSAWP